MKIYCITIGGKIVHQDLTSFSYFSRYHVGEFMLFISNTLLQRIQDHPTTIEYDQDYMAHIGPPDCVIISDRDYPARVAYVLMHRLLRGDVIDFGVVNDPEKVDKIYKIDRQLNETIQVVKRTIDSVLERGEKLDTLVKESQELSDTSKLFYQKARQSNSCCVIF